MTQTLSSDEFEGRAPTTPGEEKTVALHRRSDSQQAGLQPGNKGSWFQDVPLVEITAARQPALRITGGNGAARPSPTAPTIVGTTYQVQPRVAVENSEIVFVGYGINAPERGWNDYAGRRRPRQDGGHPGQRSRLADARASTARSTAGR